jgi:ubiquitin conjugation factor E4 B
LDQAPIPNGRFEEGPELFCDFMALPQLMFSNLESMPKLFKQMQAESYVGQDTDLHMQLAGCISVVLNR